VSSDHQSVDPSSRSTNSRCPVEIIGFIGRIMSGRESPNWTLGPYIIQAILLLVAPVSLSGKRCPTKLFLFCCC
jgi:hypothetical protein